MEQTAPSPILPATHHAAMVLDVVLLLLTVVAILALVAYMSKRVGYRLGYALGGLKQSRR